MATRILQFVVKNSWVADNLRSLGSGKLYHLAYRPDDMDPEVAKEVAGALLRPGEPAEVALLTAHGEPVPVADVELHEVHDFPGYCRFDFRILRVYPEHRPGPEPAYLCRYVQR